MIATWNRKGHPCYARIALGEIYHDGEWAAIAFYRDPDSIREDFNLLEFLDIPAVFYCPMLRCWVRDLEERPRGRPSSHAVTTEKHGPHADLVCPVGRTPGSDRTTMENKY